MTSVEEIKAKIDIVELIGEFVQLRQSGANYKGLCPFHSEKTPSFLVSKEKQFFKCFGCGESGDIFTFIQKMENLDFPEALKLLAEKAGVEIKKLDPKTSNLKTRLLDLHESATQFFIDNLFSPKGTVALDYLKNKRHLTDDIIKKFQIGYALDGWDSCLKFLRTHGFSDYEIKQSGLVVEKNSSNRFYDRFRHRIMFPILDHHAKIVGYSARALNPDEPAKYINTPQTIIYNKSSILFGLDKAKLAIKNSGFVVLVEGNMDVIASHLGGVENIIATSGTSLTTDQIALIKRYTDTVAVCFDADSAGLIAGKRGIEMLWQAGMLVKAVLLPADVKDPDDLVQQDKALWQGVVLEAREVLDFLFQKTIPQNTKTESVEEKRRIAGQLLPWINKVVDLITKNHYLKLLAEKISIDEQVLHNALSKYNQPKSNQFNSRQNITKIENKISQNELRQERLLSLLVFATNLLKNSHTEVRDDFFTSPLYQRFYQELLAYYQHSNTLSVELMAEYFKDKKQTDLIALLDSLYLFGQEEFSERTLKELEQEYKMTLGFIRQQYIDHRSKLLQEKISQAEKTGNNELAGRLLKELDNLKNS